MTLEERVARLEDDRAIRDLKMRYLRATDLKQVDELRECLTEDATVAFDGFPPFDTREAFIAVYEQMGCAPGIFDIHHGGTGTIAFSGPDEATGQWPLFFHNIALAQRTLTQMGVHYEDRYVRREGRWWIAETRSRRTSCLIHTVDEAGAAKVAVMGEPPAQFGEAG